MDRNNKTIFNKATKVTKSDTNDSGNVFAGLYIGEGGDLAVVPMTGVSANVTFENMPTGTVFPLAVARVLATGNTCSGIVGLN
jgi:hypothetical protein